MKYDKPPLTLEQQADLLLSRGMTGDRSTMIERLSSVNYYRLTGYCYPFRNPDDTFKPGVTFDLVWGRYVFDRRLRLVVMDAIERIEVAVRSQLAHQHSLRHGPFGYAMDPNSLPKCNPDGLKRLLAGISEETSRSKERFVAHFRQKYGAEHEWLPVWMVAEMLSFGTMLSFFRGASHQVKQSVASKFGLPDAVLESWLLTLNSVRNICAHHSRLWNRDLGIKPYIPRIDRYPEWHTPVKITNARIFGVLTICNYCIIKIAPQSAWYFRFVALMNEFPQIPMDKMGFPSTWKESPLWRQPA